MSDNLEADRTAALAILEKGDAATQEEKDQLMRTANADPVVLQAIAAKWFYSRGGSPKVPPQ